MEIDVIGFIGFGLIGGSIALSLKEKHPNIKLIAYNHRKEQTNENLQLAYQDGTLDEIVTNLEDFRCCDIIFLCAPVLTNIQYLKNLPSIIKPNCILTDVGSVKGNIMNAAKALNLTQNFIGGHPMAGSEKTGYSNAHSKLLENSYYILTPNKDTKKQLLSTMEALVTEVSAIPVILTAQEHDDITAAISHVPHIIATSLVNMVKYADDSSEKMRFLAAGGFKDITRIASSSPIMWQNICLTNRMSILKFLLDYIHRLQTIYKDISLENDTAIYNAFDEANEYRSNIPNTCGLMKQVYEIYLDITDETGAIATVATLLANHGISIKNIGILHNREFEQGVLKIETYREEDLQKALELLTQNTYTVYKR